MENQARTQGQALRGDAGAASLWRMVLTVSVVISLQIALAVAIALMADRANAASHPPVHQLGLKAPEAQAPAQDTRANSAGQRINVAQANAPAHYWTVTSRIGRHQGIVTLREQGTARWQRVFVQMPGSGRPPEVHLIKHQAKDLPHELAIAVRDRVGRQEWIYLSYDAKGNRFNRQTPAAPALKRTRPMPPLALR